MFIYSLVFSPSLYVPVCSSITFCQVCGLDGWWSRVLLQPNNEAVHVGPARGAGRSSWCWQTHPGAAAQERHGGQQEDRCGLTRVLALRLWFWPFNYLEWWNLMFLLCWWHFIRSNYVFKVTEQVALQSFLYAAVCVVFILFFVISYQ